MFKKAIAISALMFASLLVSACATNRSSLTLEPPPAAPALAADAPAIVLRSVRDARAFEAAPRDPSVPSIGTAGGGAEIRARAVGRKRNSYGQALGDVMLEEGQTVEGLMRLHIAAAFQQGGVRVIEESAASPETPRVDVTIDKFWAWFQPGFWAIKLRAKVETGLSVNGGAPVIVAVEIDHAGQAATDGFWRQTLHTALAAYRTELAARAGALAAPAPAPVAAAEAPAS